MARTRKAASKTKAKSSAGKSPGLQITSPRRQRRAAIRTSSVGSTLGQRRSHFERVVYQHILHRRARGVKDPWKFDPTAIGDEEMSLLPADAESCLENEETAAHFLYVILQKLRKVPNDSDSSEDGEKLEEVHVPTSTETQETQEEVPEVPDLAGLALVMANENFISHESDEIRLFVACILAEILRISAPNPPLSETKLKALCTLFIDELSIIAYVQDHLARFRFSLLEQLSTVKTFAIFADEEHVVADIFACFYASTRPHQPAKYKEHLGYILSTLVEEVPEIEQGLLDALLAPLTRHENPQNESVDAALKTFSSYSASAAALAEHVLAHSKNLLQVPVCNFFNSALHQLSKGRARLRKSSPTRRSRKNSEADNGQEVDSELIEDIEKLLVSVNRIAPDMLIYVIPSLEERLASEEGLVRRNMTHLLGKLFLSSSATIDAYPSLFAEYLRRARDRDEAVRSGVCATIGPLLVSNPRHRELLDKKLQERVLDPDEKVRRVIAVTVGRTGAFASSDLIRAVSSRMRDKKASVRHEAFRQLSALYRTELKLDPQIPGNKGSKDQAGIVLEDEFNGLTDMMDISDSPADGDTEMDEQSRAEEVRIPEWMSQLPNIFLSTHQSLQASDDTTLLTDIEKTIFEQLYSWDSLSESDDRLRVRKFSALLGSLESKSLVYLSRLVSRKARLASILRKVCTIRLKGRSAENEALRASLTPPKPDGDKQSTPVVERKKTFSKRGRAATTKSPEEKKEPKELESRFNRDLRSASDALAALLGRRKYRNEEVSDLCWKMCNFPDRKFFEQLYVVVSLKSPLGKLLAAGPDAVARLSSKSVLGEFVGSVVLPAARGHLFTIQHVKAAFSIVTQYCADMKGTGDAELQSRGSTGLRKNTFIKENDVMYGVLRYIELSSLHVPEVYVKLTSLPAELIREARHGSLGGTQILLCGLKVLARVNCSVIGEEQRSEIISQLHSIITEPVRQDAQVCAVLAKWATKALINACRDLDSSSAVWNKTRSILKAKLGSSEDNALELVGPVTALGQIAKLVAPVFKSCYLESLDYALALLSGTYNSKLCHNLHEKRSSAEVESNVDFAFVTFWQSSFPPSCGGCHMVSTEPVSDVYISSLAELARRAVKLMVYALHAVDADNQDVDRVIYVLAQGTMKISGTQEKYGDIFELQRHMKSEKKAMSDGEDSEGKEADSDDESDVVTRACNIIRLASSCGIIYLARSNRHFRRVKPDDILCAMMCVQDIEPEVRISFARNIHRYVLRKRLPFRWIASLALMAHDPDRANQSEVRILLAKALREKRNRISIAQPKSSSIRKLLPEACVPVLIWVLANHPDAEKDAENQYINAELCMDFLLDRLLESNEYAAVIQEYLDALMVSWEKSEAGDEPGPKTERIRILARICTVLLKKRQAGKKWNLLEHPGRVDLPGDLFRREADNAENSAVAPSSLLDVARIYDAGARSEDPSGQVVDSKREDTSGIMQTPQSTVRTPVIVRDLGSSTKRSNLDLGTPGSVQNTAELSTLKTSPATTRRPVENLFPSPKSHSSKSSAQKRPHRGTNQPASKHSSSDSSASKRRKRGASSNVIKSTVTTDEIEKEGPSSGDISTKVGGDTPKSDPPKSDPSSQSNPASTACPTEKKSAPKDVPKPAIRKSARLRRLL